MKTDHFLFPATNTTCQHRNYQFQMQIAQKTLSYFERQTEKKEKEICKDEIQAIQFSMSIRLFVTKTKPKLEVVDCLRMLNK